MTPLYFGTTPRRLFGVYSPPRTDVLAARAAVLCYPWGQEYIRAHRSMRQLATMLSAAGYHVLRFDYFGTGDSAGDMVEADLAGWERDVETAIDELRDTAGLQQVALVGLRLGATLAAQVAVRRPADIEALVLWDPVVMGAEYLAEIVATEARQNRKGPLGADRSPGVGGGHEILGFPLTEALERQVAGLDLTKLIAGFPARTRLISSLALASHERLRARLLEHARDDVFMERIDSQLAWLQYQELGAGAVPARVLERIVKCLECA